MLILVKQCKALAKNILGGWAKNNYLKGILLDPVLVATLQYVQWGSFAVFCWLDLMCSYILRVTCWKCVLSLIIIIMEICKAPTLQLKVLNKHNVTHIMYIEMENGIHSLAKS